MNWPLLQNSLLVAAVATLLATAAGFAFALGLLAASPQARRWLLAGAVVAFALPPFLIVNCWLDLLGHNGLLRACLPLDIYSLPGAAWVLALMLWPVTALLVAGAWTRLQPVQLEADAHARGLALLRWVLWPMARAALGQAAALTFVLALNQFAVPAILQVKVFPAELWVSFNTTFDNAAAVRLCVPMVIAPLVLLFWLARRETAWPKLEPLVSSDTARAALGNGIHGMSILFVVGLLGVAVILPLGDLVGSARTWTEVGGAMAAGRGAIWNSFWLAATAAGLSVTVGVLAACVGITARALEWLVWLPLLVPGVLLGILLIGVFNRPSLAWFYQGFGVVLLGLGLRYLAVGWNGAALAWRGLDRDLVDAARLCGASGWSLFRRALWPQLAPRLAGAAYVVYLLCLWDAETLVLIVPPGGETLALRIFNLLHYGHNAQVNALCLVLLALALAPLIVWRIAADARRLIIPPRRSDGTSLRRLLPVAAGAVLLVGCAPKQDEAATFRSRLFSRVEIIGSRGTGAGQFNKPRSIAFDRDDNLYVADMTGRVQKFSPDGKFLLLWQMEETDKGKPKGMCRDEQGNIVVVEPHYSRVNHFAPDGKLAKQWGANGTNAGQLYFPRAVAVGARGETWVSEYGHTERVQKFSGQGAAFVLGIGRPGGGAGEFNRAEGIGLAPDGTLFVADSCNHRVQIFSADGGFLREFGKAGGGAGELSYPYDVRVDVSGLIYVCEFGNSRVQVFDSAGNTVEIIGRAGVAPGEFANPWSIALDSKGNLFVADSQNHRVQKFITKLTRKSVVRGQWSVDERERALANATDNGRRTTDPARP